MKGYFLIALSKVFMRAEIFPTSQAVHMNIRQLREKN